MFSSSLWLAGETEELGRMKSEGNCYPLAWLHGSAPCFKVAIAKQYG
jgi:hypothetical protein